jgi:NAD(P)-dependent dehydrogenase (short-subunit alcohol dehydrogenase family)
MPEREYKFLLFGSTGAIGSAVAAAAHDRNWSIVAASRSANTGDNHVRAVQVDPFDGGSSLDRLRPLGPFSSICWAQGANANDSVYQFDPEKHLEIYKANCLFIIATLQFLLSADLLVKPSRMCIISSIWQTVARQKKLSYSMSKAALQGLVLSASTDLAADGHLINAVLPGAIDTPMTRQNLQPEQISKLQSSTKFNRLPTMHDVTSLVLFLCSAENTGITGQFVAADLGFSRVHLL